jgi:tyrosine-specific transport protein
MTEERKKFFYSVSTIIGTMIGVGIFGIPYVLSKAGFRIGIFYFLILGFMVVLVNLFYGEIILRTKEPHRLVGYAEKYLGKWGKGIVTFSQIFGFYGALLAYIIIGGQFLFFLIFPVLGGTDLIYTLIFFGVNAFVILVGLRLIAEAEFIMNIFLFLTFIIILLFAFPAISVKNFLTIDLGYFFLPYGVILFALGSLSAIPEAHEILKGDSTKFKKIIKWGTIIPIIVTFLFALAIVGVLGKDVTQEALGGLKGVLGDKFFAFGIFFGLLAVVTSFLILGLNLKKVFWYDWKINKYLAWFLTCFIPLGIFLWGGRDFIKVISITGGVLGGLDGLIVALIYLKAKKKGDRSPEYSLSVPKFLPFLLMLIFGLGILYELYYLAF